MTITFLHCERSSRLLSLASAEGTLIMLIVRTLSGATHTRRAAGPGVLHSSSVFWRHPRERYGASARRPRAERHAWAAAGSGQVR